MTDTTSNTATGATPSVSDLLTIAQTIIRNIEDHEDSINFIAGMAGILPEVALAEKALPMIAAVLQFMQEQTGKSLIEVFQDVLSHLTPGGPNSAVLTSLPEGS
jgi:hypothetical protein